MTYLLLGIAAVALLSVLSYAATPAEVGRACSCEHCSWYLNKRPGCSGPMVRAPYIPISIIEGLLLKPITEPGPVTFLRYKYPLIRRVNARTVAEKLVRVEPMPKDWLPAELRVFEGMPPPMRNRV